MGFPVRPQAGKELHEQKLTNHGFFTRNEFIRNELYSFGKRPYSVF